MIIEKNPRFFYGAVSADGFRSLFDKIYSAKEKWRAYIIKGGPGSGKSTFMKKIAESCGNDNTLLGPCSSDPDSLDAVVFPDKKVCIIDGTAPHVIEPKYPGICESIVNIGDCWDKDMLFKSGDDAITAFNENAAHHRHAARYISAIGSLLNGCMKTESAAVCSDKLQRFAKNLALRELGDAKGDNPTLHKCYLSAITPKGYIFYENTVHSLCKKVIAIEDQQGECAHRILSVILNEALIRGLEVIACLCPILPDKRLEHLLIPSLSLAFCTSNSLHKIQTATRRIHTLRFCNKDVIYRNKEKLNFSKKMTKELINGAVQLLTEAKASHDKMEQFYINAMDFDKLNLLCDKICNEISLIK